MANKNVPDAVKFNAAIKLHENGTSITGIGKQLGLPRTTVDSWLKNKKRLTKLIESAAAKPEEVPTIESVPETVVLKDKIRTLEAQLKNAAKEQLDAHYVRNKIFNLAESVSEPPNWLLSQKSNAQHAPGIPSLMASDWHFGEIVDPTQIGGVNEYNLAIAHARARAFVDGAVDLLMNHTVNPTYPGIVLNLGGDMVSGDIHEELTATNEIEIMPTVVDLHGILVWVIRTLADKFGRVFVPCVTGNHGRDTKKIRAKGRNFTSFDWLLYTFLEKTFNPIDPITGNRGAGYDDRVTFLIPNSSDCLYKIYNHRYLLSHGDQFRGGDGMIGALGPIIRGDHKKRTRNNQINLGYDTLLLGHFHQLIFLERLIVNGSLIGYNEYAYASNFAYEPPRQALWLTHPARGRTITMPVMVDKKIDTNFGRDEWVSWK